jgi:hypothetical protein
VRSLGVKPGVDLDRALRIAGEMEDEETLRTLALRRSGSPGSVENVNAPREGVE